MQRAAVLLLFWNNTTLLEQSNMCVDALYAAVPDPDETRANSTSGPVHIWDASDMRERE